MCARLIEDCSRPRPVDQDAVWRIKGSSLLGRPALAVLRELWHWREHEAIRANRPPFFVLSHEVMVKVAVAATTNHPVDPMLPRHFSERRRAGLKTALAAGRAVPPEKMPRHPVRVSRRPTEAERRRFLDLERRRDARAASLGLDATLIASRATLYELARSWDKHAGELMNWQRELLS
jgi:ribonuclease D